MRIPSAPNTFILPVNGEFDVSDQIGPFVASSVERERVLDFEVWGWNKENLVFLGAFRQTLKPGQATIPIVLAKASAPAAQTPLASAPTPTSSSAPANVTTLVACTDPGAVASITDWLGARPHIQHILALHRHEMSAHL